MNRRIKYVTLDLACTKLFVFVDGSFANNKDFSSQIGYLIILAPTGNEESEIKENLIHYSSTKSKRVTRAYLLRRSTAWWEVLTWLSQSIRQSRWATGFPTNPDYHLYGFVLSIRMPSEAWYYCLMIDIMALRQSYERREITEIRWIDGKNNPADAMTKSAPNGALGSFLTTNRTSRWLGTEKGNGGGNEQELMPFFWSFIKERTASVGINVSTTGQVCFQIREYHMFSAFVSPISSLISLCS